MSIGLAMHRIADQLLGLCSPLVVPLSRGAAKSSQQCRGATIATYEAIWLRRLLQDLRIEVPTPILIYCDNLSSMHLAKNPMFHARRKHIEVHYHFVHERVPER